MRTRRFLLIFHRPGHDKKLSRDLVDLLSVGKSPASDDTIHLERAILSYVLSYLALTPKMARWQPHYYLGNPGADLPTGIRRSKEFLPAEQISQSGAGSTPISADVVSVSETTTFLNDTETKASAREHVIPIDRGLFSSVSESRIHEVKNFLQRPVVIQNGTWTTAQTANTLLYYWKMPDVLVNSSMPKSKLQGFLGFKATTVVRVQLNGHRFMQGRLLLHYLPQEALQTDRAYTANCHLVLKTQQPRVDIDVASDPDVSLSMPYVSPLLYTDLSNSQGPFGTYYLSVYSPLVAPSGSTSCELTVWAHFEDIELVMPTVPYSSFTAQGPGLREFVAQGPGPKRSHGTSAIGRSVDPSDREIDASSPFKLSDALGKVSALALELGKIPLLSSVAGSAAWVTERLAGAASSFGFSNPSSTGTPIRTTVEQFAHACNADGIDSSKKMAILSGAHVEHLPGFAGTDIDEMAISHIVGIMCYNDNPSWTTSQVHGTILASYSLRPMNFYGQPSMVSGKAFNAYCPMGYVNNVFQYWRGSIKFTLKFIKTEFHSGRIGVAFVPGERTPTARTISDFDWCYKEILDIRDSNEYTVSVPFVNSTPWLDKSVSMGSLYLYVANELVAPSGVSSTITVLLEVGGGNDMEFAFPVPIAGNIPCCFFNAGYAGLEYADSLREFKAQGLGPGEAEASSSAQISAQPPDISSSDVHHDRISAAKYCIGEQVTSIRQLVKRACPWFWPGAFISGYAARPHVVEVLGADISGTPILRGASTQCDYINYFGPLYAYRRGGIRLKAYCRNGDTATGTWRAGLFHDVNSFILSNSISDVAWSNCLSIAMNPASSTGGIELEIPQYCKTAVCYNMLYNVTCRNPIPGYYEDGKAVYIQNDGQPVSMATTRQAADDFSFGFFIGTLPILQGADASMYNSNW